jgi:hypothetical protein
MRVVDARGAETRGADARGAETRGAETRGADARGAETRGAETRGAEVRGADRGAERPDELVRRWASRSAERLRANGSRTRTAAVLGIMGALTGQGYDAEANQIPRRVNP